MPTTIYLKNVTKRYLKPTNTTSNKADLMYVPESPRRIHEIYRPSSPRFMPSSPKIHQRPTGFLGNIMNNMDKKFSFRETTYRPIANFDAYIHHKKRIEGEESERVKIVEAKHNSWLENNTLPEPIVITRKTNPTPVDQVYVNLKCKSKSVQVVIEPPPIMVLQENYYSKGIMPPLDVYIRQLKKFGYDDELLEHTLETFTKRQKNKNKDQEFLEIVFGKGKKTKKD